MKRLLTLLAAMAVALSFSPQNSAADDDEGEQSPTVVVVKGSKPFTVQEKDLVRIEAGGVAGAVVTTKVSGSAKLRKYIVRRVVDGSPIAGLSGVEFEVTPTGKGKVTVEVSVKNPTDAKARLTKYEFEVK